MSNESDESLSLIFRQILNDVSFPVLLIDRLTKIRSCNPISAEFLNCEPGQLVGRQFEDFLNADSHRIFLDAMQVLSVDNTSKRDLMLQTKLLGDKHHWLEVRLARIRTSSPNSIFYMILHDVSPFMDLNQQLREEKDIAEQATRSKSSFLANMSHEIRTPIHTITGMTELLIETKLDDEQQEYVKQISFAAEVLLSLINDILDFSKIEAGKLNLELIRFDMQKVTEDALDMQSLEAFKKGLEVILDIRTRLPNNFLGDPSRIRQVITNLLSNSIKFTKEGQVQLIVEYIAQTAILRLEIVDSGIGIPEAKKDLLFQSFSQVDASTTRKFGGTGLGLSICKSLVQMMQGSIGIESKVQQGSVFWFELPCPPESFIAPAPHSDFRLDGLAILLLDDNAIVRSYIKANIEALGGKVTESSSAMDGLNILRENHNKPSKIHLVLVDLDMPGMDAWQFASEVNNDKSINEVRLILLNPPGKMAGEAKMKLLNWFDAYISKPVKVKELIETLRKTLSIKLDLRPNDDDVSSEHSDQKNDQGSNREPLLVANKYLAARILVAEDHFVNQKLFVTMLNSLGCQTSLASDGKQAYEKACADNPDLIFMDVQMPVLDGYEATKLLRQFGYSNPIVAVTANALKGDIDRCLQSGMDDYLAKPFQKKDLQNLIVKWTKRNLAVFDTNKALDAFVGDKATLMNVLKTYLEESPESILSLMAHIEAKNYPAAASIAHRFKGSALSIAADALGTSAGLLESALLSKDIEIFNLSSLSQALQRDWDSFVRKASQFMIG